MEPGGWSVVVVEEPRIDATTEELREELAYLLEAYKEGLAETKSDLNREEWKFVRLSEHLIERAGAGVLGLVVNRPYLDGVTHRHMRRHLLVNLLDRIAHLCPPGSRLDGVA